jgi:hypothetical protein
VFTHRERGVVNLFLHRRAAWLSRAIAHEARHGFSSQIGVLCQLLRKILRKLGSTNRNKSAHTRPLFLLARGKLCS